MKRMIRSLVPVLLLLVIFPYAAAAEPEKNVLIKIEGMTGSGCAATVRSSLLKVNGIKKADVDWKKGEARVVYDPKTVGVEQLTQAVVKAGFKVTSMQGIDK